jgi:hypothetical protein
VEVDLLERQIPSRVTDRVKPVKVLSILHEVFIPASESNLTAGGAVEVDRSVNAKLKLLNNAVGLQLPERAVIVSVIIAVICVRNTKSEVTVSHNS